VQSKQNENEMVRPIKTTLKHVGSTGLLTCLSLNPAIFRDLIRSRPFSLTSFSKLPIVLQALRIAAML
jgi:hypothetical protein